MDSLTQLVLGATIGEATLGRVAHRRGALYGAVCGTLPDLDVAWPYADAVAAFTWHRTWSHSLLVLSLLALALFWLIRRFDARATGPPGLWLVAVWLALVTHPLLDALTVYGTQLLLPFSDYPVSGSVLFIIDPLYTLPLAGCLIAALLSGSGERGRTLARAGLLVSCAYLALALAAKVTIERDVRASLAERGVTPAAVLTTPTPFNIVLWRAVVMFDDRYEVSYWRVVGGTDEPPLNSYPNGHRSLAPVTDAAAVERLRWFTHGFFNVREIDGRMVMTDLRMGIEHAYIFSFAVARHDGAGWRATPPAQLPPPDVRTGAVERIVDAWNQATGSPGDTVQ
ncbi:MAG: metal-dependent hydrolase [Pseudomonadota bacterium]